MMARRRRRTATFQDSPEIQDSDHVRSRRSQRPALRPRRSVALRRLRYRGHIISLRGSPSQVIVIDSDSGGDNDEDGGVSLLSPDGGLHEVGDDEEEDKDMATLPKSPRELKAEENMDFLNNNTGSWHSELVRLENPSRWMVRVEGASKLLLRAPTSLRADSISGGSLTGPRLSA